MHICKSKLCPKHTQRKKVYSINTVKKKDGVHKARVSTYRQNNFSHN